MKEVNYQALFFNQETIDKLRAMQEVDLGSSEGGKYPPSTHCTFKFAPSVEEIKNFYNAVVGKAVTLKVIGYACDGKNSGFLIELPEEVKSVYTNSHIEVDENNNKVNKPTCPHVTVSMSADGKAVNTGKLDFKMLPADKTFEVVGIGGFFVIDKDKKDENGNFYKGIEFEIPESLKKQDCEV